MTPMLPSWPATLLAFALAMSPRLRLQHHVIFNHRAYTQRVDRIFFCKSSSFSIHDIAS
jgi:hypothetical protein